MRHCCRNCQFLMKTHREPGGRESRHTWSKQELKLEHPQYVNAACYKDVWNQGANRSIDLRETLLKNRKDKCFFIENTGMQFPGAVELEDRRFKHQQLRRTQRYMLIAIGVSILSVFVSSLSYFLR